MDALIVLFLVIGLIDLLASSDKRKKRQEAQRRAPQGQPQQRASAAQARAPGAEAPKSAAARAAAPAPASEPRPQSAIQGESEAEHAEHRRRIAAEEARLRRERDELRDLRAANRDKLRAAVVMSEVLGKPVALRPRTGYRR